MPDGLKRIATLTLAGVLLAGCASEPRAAQPSKDFSDSPQPQAYDAGDQPSPHMLADTSTRPATEPAEPRTRNTRKASEETLVNRPTRPRDKNGKPIDEVAERPGPDNTGVKDQKNLKRAAKIKVTDGQVIENLFITGGIKASDTKDVVIRNCVIDAGGDRYGVVCQGATNLVIEHCEIYNMASAGVYGDGFTARFNQVSQSKGDGFKAGNNVVIEGNYVHTLGFNSPGAHADGVQIRGSKNIKIIGNYFDMPINNPETHSNAGVFIQGFKEKQRTAEDILVERNWFRGGNFTVAAYSDGGDASTIRIIDNRFYQGEARYGCGKLQEGVVWTGNVFDGSGAPAAPNAK